MLTIDFERLALQPGMHVLDAGCGQGRHSLELLRRGCTALALDLNPDDLRYTRYLLSSLAAESAAVSASLPPHLPPHTVLRGDTLALPLSSGAFDRVLCSEVLEHVTRPLDAAKELVRVLKPGGLLAVSVPTASTEWPYLFASDDYFRTPGGHVRIFTAQRLFRLLEDAGLYVVDIHFEHAFHSLYWWVRCVFGLHDEAHPAIRHFRKILTHVMFSPTLTRLERRLNWLWPKSMVVYARRRPDA